MVRARSTCGWLLALLYTASLSGGCAPRPGPIEQASSTKPQDPSHKMPQAVDAEQPTPHPDGSVGAAARGKGEPPATGPTHLIRYHFKPDRPLYYVIENDFVDHGGVPGFLSYTTIVNDRRTIIQTVEPQAKVKNPAAKNDSVRLLWVCDRYEVTEKGMKDKVSFDSLRDLYPRAVLRALGAVPGSKVFFDFDPHTGKADKLRIQPGKIRSGITRKKLSSTAKRCEVSRANLTKLLDDLGPLFIPDSPKAVGETWTRRREEAGKSYGRAIRDYTFTFKEVRDEAGRKIAIIEVRGDVRLPADQASAKAKQGSQRRPSQKQRQFKIDKKLCTGSIEFDLTHGELVRLTLRRALDLSAKMESKTNQEMSIETGFYHVLRVEVSETPPAKPMIVGGPKPPPEEPEAAPRRATPAVRPPNRAGRPSATTRPRPRNGEPRRVGPTSRPAVKPADPRRRPNHVRPPPRLRPSISRQRALRRPVLLPRPASQPTSQPAKTPS